MDVPHMFWHLIKFVVLWCASSAAVFSGTIDPQTPDAEYVEFGKQFPCVVQIKAKKQLTPTSARIGVASAVIVAPHWIVTAAHVIDDDYDSAYVLKTAEDVEDKRYVLDRLIMHPQFDPSVVGFHDIALCHTPQDFGLDFYVNIQKTCTEVGKVATISGWGSTGTFYTGYHKNDNIRRAGRNKIDAAVKSVLLCTPSRPSYGAALEFMICPGDSGGGLFIGNNLAGIVSYISAPAVVGNPKAKYGDTSAFTRVSIYSDWILEHISDK